MKKNPGPEDERAVTFVEFYAGVGGWRMALAQALQRCAPKRRLEQLAALDHSDLCLKVLEHNSPSKNRTVSIERLTLKQLEEWEAMVWCMSPPCQPHTRQHENQQQDLVDPRSRSFLHLCNLLEQMKESKLPRLLLMENVVGFEAVSLRPATTLRRLALCTIAYTELIPFPMYSPIVVCDGGRCYQGIATRLLTFT